MVSEFRKVGDILFLMGLVHYNSGNISARVSDGIWITKTGKSLYNLHGKDIVKIGYERDIRWDSASSETPTHIEIYKKISSAKAIVHSHSPYTVTLSFLTEKITPIDYESSLRFCKPIDILNIDYKQWDERAYIDIPSYLEKSENSIVVAKGHGVFAYGNNLFEALEKICSLEFVSRIILEVKNERGSRKT
ncbi:MAG: class II aldolase/adducin family protein [Deltaproteobacteria bacterium]|nr:class II aldolase/adducin family protein [Deltaproteobacteria bacterium]